LHQLYGKADVAEGDFITTGGRLDLWSCGSIILLKLAHQVGITMRRAMHLESEKNLGTKQKTEFGLELWAAQNLLPPFSHRRSNCDRFVIFAFELHRRLSAANSCIASIAAHPGPVTGRPFALVGFAFTFSALFFHY
jgi:hypothetical protein